MEQSRLDRLNELAEKEKGSAGLVPQEREELRLLKMEQLSEMVMGGDDEDEE